MTTLSIEDLFTLRDALIHAEQAHATDADPTLRQRYITLFTKLGVIVTERRRGRRDTPRGRRESGCVE